MQSQRPRLWHGRRLRRRGRQPSQWRASRQPRAQGSRVAPCHAAGGGQPWCRGCRVQAGLSCWYGAGPRLQHQGRQWRGLWRPHRHCGRRRRRCDEPSRWQRRRLHWRGAVRPHRLARLRAEHCRHSWEFRAANAGSRDTKLWQPTRRSLCWRGCGDRNVALRPRCCRRRDSRLWRGARLPRRRDCSCRLCWYDMRDACQRHLDSAKSVHQVRRSGLQARTRAFFNHLGATRNSSSVARRDHRPRCQKLCRRALRCAEGNVKGVHRRGLLRHVRDGRLPRDVGVLAGRGPRQAALVGPIWRGSSSRRSNATTLQHGRYHVPRPAGVTRGHAPPCPKRCS
mmetsp:Transcript_109939/g.310094  ORF Transcript_109939/g.310094 Transcript_109939/m.310094 type:complete len:339 (-) Transcript_109939:69-1085(-)